VPRAYEPLNPTLGSVVIKVDVATVCIFRFNVTIGTTPPRDENFTYIHSAVCCASAVTSSRRKIMKTCTHHLQPQPTGLSICTALNCDLFYFPTHVLYSIFHH
jgi:hypothetical protein